ncbi:MAG TPA: precorrin-3B C(17)-methyltransferase [Opitutaceae bacterium]|jgi:precorrin-3B C17-methyltransferase|nr:precorrin-3B C(17)-methyltransferase [Opitutaceae bacterium]
MKLSVVGIGPGGADYILPLAARVLGEADVVIGYKFYLQFVQHLLRPGCEIVGNAMMEEEERARLAVAACAPDHHVVVVSSGDAGIYAMAALIYEHVASLGNQGAPIELQTIPGISAFLAAGGKLGAVLGHDFCCVSLSDLMTPWRTIERRLEAAALGDFVTTLYNPRSQKRTWQIERARALFLRHRSPDTPVALVRQVTRPEERILHSTLAEFPAGEVDMFTVVVIGNAETFRFRDFLVTPRGFSSRKPVTGPAIQQESFRLIADRLTRTDLSPADRSAVVRCIHTTADFEYERLYHTHGDPLPRWHDYLARGGTIVSDVTMVQSGVSKEFVRRFGLQVHCCLNEPEAVELAQAEGITRAQAGMRLAMARHPGALFAVGNAPTALNELSDGLQSGTFRPAGVIAAPVGFVNVVESKLRLRHLGVDVPCVIIEGNKGGSGVAAAIVNAACALDAPVSA